MADTKFTAGPWRLQDGGNIGNQITGYAGVTSYPNDDGFRTVGMFQSCCPSGRYDDQEENRLANGFLMTAAPDLFEAVERMMENTVKLYSAIAHGNSEAGQNFASNDSVYVFARAAIAKALGETA